MLDDPTRLTLTQLQRSGKSQPVFERQPSLYPILAWVYEAYWLIDRDMNGLPTYAGMREVLDEHGVTDRAMRSDLIALWMAMKATEIEAKKDSK